MLSSELAGIELHHRKTSGSTGVSVQVLVDEAAQQFQRACTLRSDEWSGWRLGERIASIWGNPQIRADWRGRLRRALLERNYVYLDTLKMDEAAMARFADVLVRTPPSLLFGHAHSLHLFAAYLKARRPRRRDTSARHHLDVHGSARLGAAHDRGGVRVPGDQPLRMRGGQPHRLRVRTARGAAH